MLFKINPTSASGLPAVQAVELRRVSKSRVRLPSKLRMQPVVTLLTKALIKGALKTK